MYNAWFYTEIRVFKVEMIFDYLLSIKKRIKCIKGSFIARKMLMISL